jgi:MFS superfamily sulfate permease-like transporter
VAYSSIASIPPRYGLYTGFIPYIIFGCFGTDKYVSYGPFALMSLLIATALHEAGFTVRYILTVLCLIFLVQGCTTSEECNHPSATTQDYVDAAITLSFLVGITYWVMAAIRLTQFSTLLAGEVLLSATHCNAANAL